VITPYTAQQQAIEDELVRRVGRETAETVAVGTVHTFQGGERDVMIFSPVLVSQRGT
jgi:superfamily I DNA and/or RNA helicase